VSVSARALWYIEAHLGGDLSLEAVASGAGVSRFHLSRAFALTLAHTIAGYARARRLSEAAKALACGAPSILDVALAAGYGSHEAFTRAFHAQFGATPEQVRARASTRHLQLQEPLRMSAPSSPLEKPRIVRSPALRLVGLAERYQGSNAGIPAQWGRFEPHLAAIPARDGNDTFGAMYDYDEAGTTFTYLCAVAVKELPAQLGALTKLELPARSYAVWTHREHVSLVAATCQQIFEHGLASAGLTPEPAPMFERYGDAFDPRTGNGGLEVWVPVKA
jgi:AraC family transcriptional regulator